MGDDAGEKCALRLAAAAARKWLEDVRIDREGRVHPAVASGGQALTWLATAGARVSLAEPGRVVCSLRVRAPLTDAEGRWHAGAIAVAADNVCAAAVFTALGADVLTVQYSLSYFSPAHLDEEVEMEGRVVGRKATLAAATVEVRKKESGELVVEFVIQILKKAAGVGERSGGPSRGGLGRSVATPTGLQPAAQRRLGGAGGRSPPRYGSFPTQFRVSPL